VFSTCSVFHQQLHTEAAHASHGCVLCLFLQGQIDSPNTVPIHGAFVFGGVLTQFTSKTLELLGADRRLSPSRGPPFFFSCILAG
jgi:hypothetical protein